MKIYTKVGDLGETKFHGEMVSKKEKVFYILGTIDEAQAVIGTIYSNIFETSIKEEEKTKLLEELKYTMDKLFQISAGIYQGNDLVEGCVEQLEEWMDEKDNQLNELTNFILPIGSISASQAHLARAVVRRLEREFTKLNYKEEKEIAASFLNRLSDYLFVIARYVNFKLGVSDILSSL